VTRRPLPLTDDLHDYMLAHSSPEDPVLARLAAETAGEYAAAAVMQGSRGGVDLPQKDIPRVKSHLAKYYDKLGDEAPWERDDG